MPKEMTKRKNKIGKKSKISERDKRIDRLEKTVGDLVQRLAMSSNISTTVDKISNSSNTIVIPPLASTVISPVSTTKLTYEDYKVFRSKYPGPYSNKSFVNWVAHGGKDRPLFRWPNLTPYSVPRARADKYENRGRSASRRKLEDRKDKSKYRDSTERRRSEGKESEESVYRERRQENRYRGRTEENRYQGGRKPSDYGGGRDRSIGGRSNGGIVNVYNCR